MTHALGTARVASGNLDCDREARPRPIPGALERGEPGPPSVRGRWRTGRSGPFACPTGSCAARASIGMPDRAIRPCAPRTPSAPATVGPARRSSDGAAGRTDPSPLPGRRCMMPAHASVGQGRTAAVLRIGRPRRQSDGAAFQGARDFSQTAGDPCPRFMVSQLDPSGVRERAGTKPDRPPGSMAGSATLILCRARVVTPPSSPWGRRCSRRRASSR